MMKRMLFATLILTGISVVVYADTAPVPVTVDSSQGRPILKGDIVIPQNVPSETDQQLTTARSLLSQRNYEAASALLELLYEKDPGNMQVFNLLRSSYEALQYYSKSEALIRRQLQQTGDSFELWMYLGQALAHQAKEKPADSAFHKARTMIPVDDRQRMGMLIQNMATSNMTTSAIALIDSMRIKTGEPTLFAVERGKLYEQDRQYGKAAIEYLSAITEDSDVRTMTSRISLGALLEYPEASAEAEKALRSVKIPAQQIEALRMLSQLYLKKDRFTEAFTIALQLDSIAKQNGKNLVYYMRACMDRKLYQQAVTMGKYFFSRYGATESALDMHFLYGDAFAALGNADSAIAQYSAVVQESPVNADKAEALYRIGVTNMDVSRNYDVALKVFDSVIVHYREGMAWFNAQAKRPQVFLRKGDLTGAQTAFDQVMTVQLDETNKETVQYYAGYLLFLEKQFDSSSVKLRKLTVDFPRGLYMNDALRLLLILEEAKDAPELLGRYADAERFKLMNQPESTITSLQTLMSNEDARLADLACHDLATFTLEKSDTTKAVEYLEKGIATYSESFYRPYMIKLLADIRAGQPGGKEAAQKLYRELLEKYPNHPYAADARKRMKALEGAV